MRKSRGARELEKPSVWSSSKKKKRFRNKNWGTVIKKTRWISGLRGVRGSKSLKGARKERRTRSLRRPRRVKNRPRRGKIVASGVRLKGIQIKNYKKTRNARVCLRNNTNTSQNMTRAKRERRARGTQTIKEIDD